MAHCKGIWDRNCGIDKEKCHLPFGGDCYKKDANRPTTQDGMLNSSDLLYFVGVIVDETVKPESLLLGNIGDAKSFIDCFKKHPKYEGQSLHTFKLVEI